MRKDLALLVVALILAACDHTAPSTDGILVVSTDTQGGRPDPDGYLLTVDGHDSLSLDPTGTSEISLPSGSHTLGLLGVAEQCSVTSGMRLEVDVPSNGSVSLAIVLNCVATAARITATTTGLDFDDDGYRILVDGIDRGRVPPNGETVIPVVAGNVTIGVRDLAQNCVEDGPASRTVHVAEDSLVPFSFSFVCTARFGVIVVALNQVGADVGAVYETELDGVGQSAILPGEPYYWHVTAPSNHVLSLIHPDNCAPGIEHEPVTLTAGALVRDTVKVDFSVTCEFLPGTFGFLRITAPTTGTVPGATRYTVGYSHWDPWDYGAFFRPLTSVGPLDTTIVQVAARALSPSFYWSLFELEDVPENCSAHAPDPSPDNAFAIEAGDTLDLAFTVHCSP